MFSPTLSQPHAGFATDDETFLGTIDPAVIQPPNSSHSIPQHPPSPPPAVEEYNFFAELPSMTDKEFAELCDFFDVTNSHAAEKSAATIQAAHDAAIEQAFAAYHEEQKAREAQAAQEAREEQQAQALRSLIESLEGQLEHVEQAQTAQDAETATTNNTTDIPSGYTTPSIIASTSTTTHTTSPSQSTTTTSTRTRDTTNTSTTRRKRGPLSRENLAKTTLLTRRYQTVNDTNHIIVVDVQFRRTSGCQYWFLQPGESQLPFSKLYTQVGDDLKDAVAEWWLTHEPTKLQARMIAAGRA